MDLVALTNDTLQAPNVIVHVARMVHTPVGSAPSGMILWQPDATAAPAVMGFISACPKVAAYFGANIFAGTPFEQAPALEAEISITQEGDTASCRVAMAGHVFEVTLGGLGAAALINRAPSAMPPFAQQGLERVASQTTLRVNGQEVSHIVPPAGISGGPAAVFSPCGICAR